jgi:hypothetical protein
MRKLAALAGSAALLFSMAGSAFAFFPYFFQDEATVKNYARVSNRVYTKANTGYNELGGKFVWGGEIATGAAGALTGVSNIVNANELGCGCYDDLYIKNKASVWNSVTTKANTGGNDLGGMWVGGGLIDTGDAGATSAIENIVNTNLVGGGE